MKIRFLGTGSGYPDPVRMCSSLIVEGKHGSLLLDAGEGLSHRLAQKPEWSQQISSIIITHRHVDHHSGLPLFLQREELDNRRKPLEIFMPGGMKDTYENWLKMVHLYNDELPYELNLKILNKGNVPVKSGHDVYSWLNTHLHTESESEGSFSVLFTVNSKKWIYSSDLGSIEDLDGHLDNVNGVILESTHIDVEESLARLARYAIETIYLTHGNTDSLPGVHSKAIIAEDNMVMEC